MGIDIVQGISGNADLLAPRSSAIRSTPFILSFGISFEPELVDVVSKVVVVAILEVRNKVVDVAPVEDKRASGREVEVASNLVDADTSSNVATLGVLFVNFRSPALSNALIRMK